MCIGDISGVGLRSTFGKLLGRSENIGYLFWEQSLSSIGIVEVAYS